LALEAPDVIRLCTDNPLTEAACERGAILTSYCDVFIPNPRFIHMKTVKPPICAPLDVAAVHLQIEHAQSQNKKARVMEGTPTFVPVPGTTGCISLWHFPSMKNMKQAKELGCTHVVTLQSPKENIDGVRRMCEQLELGWIQMDFWANYNVRENHTKVLQLVDSILELLSLGASFLIHCAAGIHRTGLLSYLILRRLGMSYNDAREYLRVLRPVTRAEVGDERIKIAEVKFMKWLH